MRRSRVMVRKLTRCASSQLVHRAIPRVLKREFLSVETINLWLQCKVSPWMQLVHPLDFKSIQLSLEHVQVLCQFLGCFYERVASWLRHLFSPYSPSPPIPGLAPSPDLL